MRSEEDVKALVLKRSEDAFTQAGCKVVVLDVFFLFETSFSTFQINAEVLCSGIS